MLALILVLAFFGLLYVLPKLLNRREVQRHRAAFESIRPDCYPILVPVFNRPEYLKQVFEGLRSAFAIDQTCIVVSQDGAHAEVADLADSLPLTRLHLRHTQPFHGLFSRLGLVTNSPCISSNLFFMVENTFRNTDVEGVIVLEDDLVPSRNFYTYYKWCFRKILLDPDLGRDVLTCGAYNIHSKGQIPSDEKYTFFRETDHFSPWCWALTRKRWEQVKKDWSIASWDSGMENMQAKYGLVNYRPYLSHIDYIGVHGVNMSLSEECLTYRTELVNDPIDFGDAEPVLRDAVDPSYTKELEKHPRVEDGVYQSEWDTKALPIAIDKVKELLASDRGRALKRWLRLGTR